MKGISRKRISIILIIYAVIFSFLGSTFAYWNWETSEGQKTEIVFTLEREFTCSADVGGDITPENVSLAPATCTSEKNAIKRKLVVKPTIYVNTDVYMDLWMDINSLDTELSGTENFKYALTTSENSCTNDVIVEGTFNGKTTGDKIELFSQQNYTQTTEETYYLYIWLDAEETSLETANKSFDFSLNGTCSDLAPEHTVTFDANGGYIESATFTTFGENTYTVQSDGIYQLEVWGAQGGTGVVNGVATYEGGYGGYSVGTVELNTGNTLYINVGGRGSDAEDVKEGGDGGYNGGGTGGTDSNYSSSGGNEPGAGGGGASHIATTSGLLSTLSSNLDLILIVAGGGGGGAYGGVGGAGGGIKGNTGNNTSTTVGTQTSGNVFGLGGTGGSYTGGSGGGGGGYYGGSGGSANGAGGGGGSGYIGNSSLENKAMYCYNCTTSDDESTLTYSTSYVSDEPISNYAKSGNGAVRISKSETSKVIVSGEDLPTPIRAGYTFIEWNTKKDGTGTTITTNNVANLSSNTILYAIWEMIPFVDANPDGYSSSLTNSLTVPGNTTGGAGWAKIFYTITYDSTTNQSTIVFNADSNTHRLAAAQSSYTINFTCTTSIYIMADGADAGENPDSTMTASGSLKGQGVWTYFQGEYVPNTVVVQHSDVQNNKTITISTKTTHTYDYVATGSNEVTITVATPQ